MFKLLITHWNTLFYYQENFLLKCFRNNLLYQLFKLVLFKAFLFLNGVIIFCLACAVKDTGQKCHVFYCVWIEKNKIKSKDFGNYCQT